MNTDRLQHIQALQFTDIRAAEALVRAFIQETFALDVAAVELRPLAVSLNSFNGFLTLVDGGRLFFKTHTETDTVISEYYQGRALAEAGYPVIQPRYRSTEPGRQLLIYEVIEDPSVFDLAWEIENGDERQFAALTGAQHDADDDLLRLYHETLAWQPADDAARATVHQLFYHRLTGGRLARFYGSEVATEGYSGQIVLPGGGHSLGAVRRARWEINGQVYEETLDDLIAGAARLLHPAQAGPSIIGHGDAHNGNVFFLQPPSLLYFDPAFAGRHHPLLDLAKPLFHNVFAMWMYFPREFRERLKITTGQGDGRWRVEHDYTLPPLREMFLRSKVDRVLLPILQALARRGWLRPDWRACLKAALFCCPLLTMNLADQDKFPPEIALLGLTMALEMGGESRGRRSKIDRILDEAAAAL